MSQCEGRQRLIQDITKLLNNDDSLELFKESLPSPTLVPRQSDKSGVARRARAVLRNLPRSPRVNLMFMALSGKSVDLGKDISMIEEMVSLLHEEVDCRC